MMPKLPSASGTFRFSLADNCKTLFHEKVITISQTIFNLRWVSALDVCRDASCGGIAPLSACFTGWQDTEQQWPELACSAVPRSGSQTIGK